MADIHIMNYNRHEEYESVFEKLYENLERDKNKEEGIIVIVGDVINDKSLVSGKCIQMVSNFLIRLAKIMPVIVIPGNHDGNIKNSDVDIPLESIINIILQQQPNSNIYFIKTAGIYRYENLVFGISSMFDKTKNEVIPAKELDEYMEEDNYKICMIHATIGGAKYQNEITAKTIRIKKEEFEGYDFVFLGDIHKFQYLNLTCNIAYPGSLIQQNRSESVLDHGYVKWRLDTGESELKRLENEYSTCTIYIEGGEVDDGIYEIMEYMKHLKIIYIVYDTEDELLQKIINKINKKYNVEDYEINKIISKDKNYEKARLKLLKKPKKVEFHKYFIKVVEMDVTILKEDIDYLKERFTKDIEQLSQNNNDISCNWKLLTLKFSNLISYGKDNKIIFKNRKGIVGITGDNQAGKSALLDALMYVIYGQSSRNCIKREIVRCGEKIFDGEVEIEIGNYVYFIKRSGKITEGTTQRFTTKLKFYKVSKKNKNKIRNLVEDTITKTQDKICSYFGSYKDATLTYAILQGNTINFLNLKNEERKKFLEKLFRLNFFEDIYVVVRDELTKLKQKMKQETKSIEKIMKGKRRNVYEKENEELEEEIKIEEDKIKRLKEKNEKYHKAMKMISKLKCDDNKQLEERINEIEEKIRRLESKNKKLNKSIIEYDDIINYKYQIEKIRDLEYKKSVMIDKTKNNELTFNNKCKDCNTNRTLLQKQYEEMNAEIAKIDKKIAKILEENKIDVIEDILIINKKIEEIEISKKEIDNNNNLMEMLKEKKEEYMNELKIIKEDIEKKNEIKRKLQMDNVDMMILCDETRNNNELISELKDKLFELETEKNNNLNIINQYDKTIRQLDKYKLKERRLVSYSKIIGADGISKCVLCEKLPQIESMVNDLISKVFDFKIEIKLYVNDPNKKVLKKEERAVNIYVIENEEKKSFESCCSSEKFIIEYAFKAAFTIYSNLSHPNFMIIDEGFVNLDMRHITRLQSLFEAIFENFNFILMVSHSEILKQLYIKDEICIVKKEGISTIIEDN